MDIVSVRAQVISDATGAISEIPVLLTSNGPLLPLVDYLLWHQHDRSTAWMRKVVQDVKLLLTYMKVNISNFAEPESLFHNFIQRLYTGTIGEDGLDPSGLYWKRYNHRVIGNTLTRLTDFSNWVADRQGTTPLNPLRIASSYDEMVAIAVSASRKNRAFLGHTWQAVSVRKAQIAHSTLSRRLPKVSVTDDVPAFPERYFEALLFQGFCRKNGEGQTDPAKRLNLRDVLITLLMHGAGLRLSECLHLWISDVRPHPKNPSIAEVKIHHPSLGEAPDDLFDERGNPVKCNRATYLASKHAIKPRNELLNRYRAGWKDPSLDANFYMKAHWFQEGLGRLFLQYWNLYLRQIVHIPRHHPYAFIVEQGPSAGGMYCIDSYMEAHARAVGRIGLMPAKALGTTPHGHRHAYGRRLMRAGVDPLVRQRALHHKSLGSQTIYTTPNAADISKALNDAAATLDILVAEGRHVKPTFDLEKLLAYGFADVDPDGLLSGPNPKLR